MLEGLHNAGPTFYRMTNASLKDQVGKNLLSYVDDIFLVSKKQSIIYLRPDGNFHQHAQSQAQAQPRKCVFGVTRGEALGCLVSTKGIEASPDKIIVILQMQPPQTKKEVQKLACHIAALNRFIAKLAERSLPFFSVLRASAKVERGGGGGEQKKAFDAVKQSP
jgi:hypothetical protein